MGPTPAHSGAHPGTRGPVAIIVHTRLANHVPEGVTLRCRLNDHRFTANALAEHLRVVENDPEVLGVELAQPLCLLEPR